MAYIERATMPPPRDMRGWRFATALLALLLVVSVAVNVVSLRHIAGNETDPSGSAAQRYMTSSIVVADDRYLRSEIRYSPINFGATQDE